MNSKRIEQTTRPEQIQAGKWIRPFDRTERYEKLRPIMARSYQLPSGESISVALSDLATPKNVIATPKRKSLDVLIKSTHDNQHYEVSARMGKNPNTVFLGIPDPAPNALSFKSWEPEYPKADIKPSPFTCTLMDLEEVEIRIDNIKL